MVGRAFPLAFTSSNILSGFAATGISPLNEDVYPDDDFLSSYVSDRPEPTAAQKVFYFRTVCSFTVSLQQICTFIKP
jgi:hypothetical protein